MADADGREGEAEALTSELLATHVVERRFEDDAGWWHVRRALIDTVSVALAGRTEPAVTRLLHVYGGPPELIPWAVTGDRVRADDAARINGVAGHALDFDDASPFVHGHPSVVLVTAVLAASDPATDLATIADAYAAGHEAWVLIAEALPGGRHYADGWHATSSMGTVAAAAAVARLRRLDTAATRMAIGTAASMAAGNRQNFGSMTKPLHAGMAAANGVLAAQLAEVGFTADEHQLEGEFGYLALFGSAPRRVRRPVGASLLSQLGVNIKRYPCCYFVHRAVDAVIELRDEGLRAEDVDEIEVVVQPAGLAALGHPRPRTGLEAKFSMEYCIATALIGGVLTLDDFADDAVAGDEVTQLLARVGPRESDIPPIGGAEYAGNYAVVRARTRDGAVLDRRVDVAKGDSRLPLSEDDLRTKAASCLRTAAVDEADSALVGLFSVRPASTVDELLNDLRPAIHLPARPIGHAG